MLHRLSSQKRTTTTAREGWPRQRARLPANTFDTNKKDDDDDNNNNVEINHAQERAEVEGKNPQREEPSYSSRFFFSILTIYL